MNLNQKVDLLGEILLSADEGAVGRCEQMYASLWRSAPFCASCLESESFSELDDELRFKEAAAQVGAKPDEANEFALEDWFGSVGEVMETLPSILTPQTLLVSLVNYKGEDLDVCFFDEKTKRLPVFVSKSESASLFDA